MTLKNPRSFRVGRLPAAFTLMEILVVVAIILVLAAIALPVYSSIARRSAKIVAINNMKQITTAMISYAGQNDGDFPQENIPSDRSWNGAASPLGEKVWFNVLPRMMGRKGVGDYANSKASFYSKENLLFLPGAQYPPETVRLLIPYFAFAMNTKLQRRDIVTGLKNTAKLSQVTLPSRTVAFMEESMPGEPRAMTIQTFGEGEPKTSGLHFVERYGGQGLIAFVDGHVESMSVTKILYSTGKLKVPPDTDVIWTRTPEEPL